MSNNLPHAIVTGSSSGIGQAIAEHLLAAGWQVTGLDAAPAVLSAPAFTAHTVDLSSGDVIDALAATVSSADALVHAAGVMRVGRIGTLDHAASEMMWRLHVDAASRLCNSMLPAMAGRGHGRVVLIGSRTAQGMPGRGQYAATKAAINALARSWAAEVVSQGVTVNVVSPAATATPMLLDPQRTGSVPRVPPIGRLIEPTEIAQLVAYLLSPAASAITGQDIAICGGASLPT